MKDQVLFIQGGGKAVHDQWDHRIVENLERELGPDYEVRYPRMPHEADPKYSDWKAALKQQFARLDEGAIVAGHSIGGTILLRTLADDRPRQNLGGILIAPPFVGDGGWQSEDVGPVSVVVYLRRRRLIPFAIAHACLDGASVLVGVLIPQLTG
jgi:hypothetical protein